MPGGNFDPSLLAFGRAGAVSVADGGYAPLRLDSQGGLMVGGNHGWYYEASKRGNLFMAQAIVTAPVVWTTEAGTGGPLLWNGSSTVNANLIAVGVGCSVVTTVAASLGITGGISQTAAPTTTTAIDSTTNLRIGGAGSACTTYRVGTTVANTFFMPFMDLHTGALTVDTANMVWVRLDGMITVPPNCQASVAASATATTWVGNICLVWEEVPV